MNPADYARDLDAWFVANGHPHRSGGLQPIVWRALMQQGVAPAVAGSRIVASNPAPQPAPAGLPQGFPRPGFAPAFLRRADTLMLRKCSRWVRGMAWVQIGIGVVTLVPTLLVLLAAIFSQSRGALALGFAVAIAPAFGAFAIVVLGCLLLGVGEIFLAVADLHDKYA